MIYIKKSVSTLGGKASLPAIRLPAIRSGWRVLRQQLTLLGSPLVLRPNPRRMPVHPPPVYPPSVYPPSVRDGEYFANNLRCWAHRGGVHRRCRKALNFGTSLRWWPHRRHFGTMLTHGVLTWGGGINRFFIFFRSAFDRS